MLESNLNFTDIFSTLSFKNTKITQAILFLYKKYLILVPSVLRPSSIYSWSIGHILEHEFFGLGHLGSAGSKGKKVDLSFSEQLLGVVFSTF